MLCIEDCGHPFVMLLIGIVLAGSITGLFFIPATLWDMGRWLLTGKRPEDFAAYPWWFWAIMGLWTSGSLSLMGWYVQLR
jgi:hypothetical protein